MAAVTWRRAEAHGQRVDKDSAAYQLKSSTARGGDSKVL